MPLKIFLGVVDQTPQIIEDTTSTPCLRNIKNLLIEFLRKLQFENVTEMVTKCLRMQEMGVD